MKSYNEKKTVVSAGHICLDIAPSFQEHKNYETLSQLFKPGKIIPVGSADIHIGGSVGNTGVAMKKFGADVYLMAKIGDDKFGWLIQEQISKLGVKAEFVKETNADVETAYSIVLSVKGIDRIILHNSGANNSFGFEDVDFEIVEKANLFHFGYPPIMRHMYANEGEEFIRLFKNVKQSGAATSLDMAIADEMSEGGKADWYQILQTVMPYVDIFAPSFEELVYFIDRSMYYELIEKSKDKDITDVLSIQKHVRPLADKLMKWGAKIVIIKCGARGIYFRTNTQNHIKNIGGGLSTSLLSWSCQEYFERSYKPERVVSAMGAGDVSIAAFLYSALKGIDWKEALHFAAAAGASCVTTYDALSGLESFQVMGEKIKNGWEKVE